MFICFISVIGVDSVFFYPALLLKSKLSLLGLSVRILLAIDIVYLQALLPSLSHTLLFFLTLLQFLDSHCP